MASVFRVEKSDGTGPYRTYPTPEQVRIALQPTFMGSEAHPVPSWDGLGDLKPEEVCAFASVEQMKQWFPEEALPVLAEHGYTCNAYIVPETYVRKGRKQVVFTKWAAIFEYTIPLAETETRPADPTTPLPTVAPTSVKNSTLLQDFFASFVRS